MSKRKRKPPQRRPPSSYREPARQEPEPRRGLLDLFAPRAPVASPMPRIRTSFVRGLAVVLQTPPLVAGIPIVVLIAWTVLLAFGFQGPFAYLGSLFGVPPISTLLDVTLALTGFVPIGRTGAAAAFAPLIAITAFVMATAALQAVSTTVAVERLRTGTVTSWALRRAVHVLPVTSAVGVMNVGVLILARFGALFGAGFGLLFIAAALIAGVYLLAFAPAISTDEELPLLITLSKSVRAARMPGAGNLLLATLYVVPSFAVYTASSTGAIPGGAIDVNPSIGAWVTVIMLNLVQTAVVATFAFRYLAVEDAVPDAPPPRARARR